MLFTSKICWCVLYCKGTI